MDAGRVLLAANRARLRQLEAEQRFAETKRATTAPPLPTPEDEGWWPTNRLYFYFPKTLLSTVRLRDHTLTPAELRGGGLEVTPGIMPSVENRLFADGQLNTRMAALLGTTQAERAAVQEIYARLIQGVRAIEAAEIRRLVPPETDDSGQIVARLPALTTEVEPLLDEARDAWERTLGQSRTEALEHQNAIFFARYCDGLGAVTRDFIRRGDGLSVRYTDRFGYRSFKSTTFSLRFNQSALHWEYAHLFGSGAPCELK